MDKCIFCRIAKKEAPATFVYESERVVAFANIDPLAPIHILIIPRKHIASINDLEENEMNLAGELIMAGKKIARDLAISQKGYKLLFRVGEWGGQEVMHIHLHLIGGAELYEEIRPV